MIVPAFNEAQHIARCLRSLEQQTCPPREVIVVDDGSKDRTGVIAAWHRARVVRTRHCGPAQARNLGSSLATGELLVFLDADMACGPRFLEELVGPISDGRAIGSFSRELHIGNPENRWARAYATIRRHAFPRVLPSSHPGESPNYRAIRRDDFLAVNGYDDVGYGEDMTLAPKLGRLAVCADGAYCVHFNPSSLWEIFENGRWIGRGHDIGNVFHPWFDNLPLRAGVLAFRDLRNGCGPAILPARFAYHTGLLVGLCRRAVWPDRHWK
ncbi:MAG: glycosyltransferase family 2 protein [Solirubrobacterales bacterium]